MIRAAPPAASPLLAAAAGVLHFLGFAGFGLWPLALICLAVLWVALERCGGRPAHAAAAGFVFGWVSYAGGYLWLWRIVDVFLAGNLALAALVWSADGAWFAGRYALYGTAFALVRRRGWPVGIAAVAPLLALEWLYPLLFPVYVGHALAARTVWIQISDLGGPLLLSGLVAAVNLAAFETGRWLRRQRGRPLAPWSVGAAALAGAWAYGTVRVGQVERAAAAAPALQVGIVQGNLGVQEKGGDAARDHRRYLEQTRALLAGGDLDLVVWPETVYTRGLRGPLPISGERIRAEIRTPLLFGGVLVRGESGRVLAYNSAVLIGADGVVRSAYAKNLLIPFTEYVPFADLFQLAGAPIAAASDFAAASSLEPVALGPWRLATPICYEAVRPAFVRGMMRQGRPHLLVTLANDAWFGDSQGPWLHLAMARLRAVEHRRYLVRATNSGVSAVIDPAGRTLAQTGLLRRENLRATVHMLEEATPYGTWGDWPGWLATAITLAALSINASRLPLPRGRGSG